MSIKTAFEGATELELNDVLLIVGGVLVVGLALYALEQSVTGAASSWWEGFKNDLSGPSDGESWSEYFFGSQSS